MSYEPLFDSAKLEEDRGPEPGKVAYVYDSKLELAINVALATGRPLLLSGKAGTGKSTLPADVAWKLERRFYTEVVTSRTQAQDLQWTFDSVKRLSNAMAAKTVDDLALYISRGVLWRAFSEVDGRKHAVVLLDEIDKAEPDIPNDLLVVLDQREFKVRETGEEVKTNDVQVLVVITTNGERDLPPAFIRRCVCHELELPGDPKVRDEWMKLIARRHCNRIAAELTPPGERVVLIDDDLLGAVYKLYLDLRADALLHALRQPSTAEMVDAFRACLTLKIRTMGDGPWKMIATSAMWKHPTNPPTEPGAKPATAPAPQ